MLRRSTYDGSVDWKPRDRNWKTANITDISDAAANVAVTVNQRLFDKQHTLVDHNNTITTATTPLVNAATTTANTTTTTVDTTTLMWIAVALVFVVLTIGAVWLVLKDFRRTLDAVRDRADRLHNKYALAKARIVELEDRARRLARSG